MKFRIKLILACLALALAGIILRAPAQFVTGPVVQRLITNANTGTNIFCAVGGGTAPGPSTNLVGLAVTLPFAIGGRGYAMSINCSGTNATTTTNLTITIEYSADGIDWATNLYTTWVVGVPGTNYYPCATNNPQTDVTSVMGNFALGRVRSIHHTNTGSVFITNLNVTTR